MRLSATGSTHRLILSAISVTLIVIGSFLRIPLPIVPITLQFLFVLLTAHLLRPIMAGVSVAVYLLLGLLGLPVFSGGGGPGYVFQPTFGYLIGFLFAAVTVSALVDHLATPTFGKLVLCNLAGYCMLYVCGIGYYLLLNILYLHQVVSVWQIALGFWLVFLPADMVCVIGSAFVSLRLQPVLNRK